MHFLSRRVSCVCLMATMVCGGTLPLVWGQSPPDKSGVKRGLISLPSGAGSIEGLGESFEPQLNTGGASYGVTIELPRGRAGLAPSVRVAYNSFSGNGICGIGWSMDFSSIKRQTDKGFPEYDETDNFIYDGEELVPLNNAGQDWRCENERSFSRLRRFDSNSDGILDAWEVTERDGTRHTFGRFHGQNNRWSVVEHPEKAGSSPFDRTYCWMVDSTTDLHGNHVDYEYVRGRGVLYPSRITYNHLGANFHEVLFQYEDRADAFDDYRPTFSASLDRRLKRVEVRSQGQLVRAYNFSYEYEAGDLPPELAAQQAKYLDLGVTLLKKIAQVDRSGNDAQILPPLIFSYSGLDLSAAERRSFVTPPELDLAEPNGRVQLADLDGDALPDLFATTTEGVGTVQRVALNRGEVHDGSVLKLSFAPSKLVLGSSPVDLAQTNTVVHDPKGKGLVDMSSLTDDGPNKRLETFANRARLDLVDEGRLGFGQENFESTLLANPPSYVAYGSAATRQVDINFDKRGDFVHLEPDFGAMRVDTYYLARSGSWVAGSSLLPPSYPLANTFEGQDGQPNPCVHLADMNGDRMLDLVCLSPSPSGGGQKITLSYWPLCGLGRYSEERFLTAFPTDSFELGGADLRDVFVEDFTGDGLADVLVMDGSGPETVLTLRVNIAGQRWSPPFTRTGLPRYAPRDPAHPTIFRLADLNANGSTDLLFRNTAPQSEWVYVELLPITSPSLLTRIDNSIGKRTSILYGSAADDERIARESGHPWRTFAPLALQVVRQIRIACGQDMNGDGHEDTAVAEFRYRDPYYDGFEREFRGFTFAQRIDYGDDFLWEPDLGVMQPSGGWNRAKTPTGQVSGPSLVTRFRYHTGAADQRDNDDYVGPLPALRYMDELTEKGGREEEPLKGLQWVEEKVDPVVLHSAGDGDFDLTAEAAAVAQTPEEQGRLTPDSYVYTRTWQEWTVRRLYRPAEPLPFYADQDANGVLEDYRNAPVAPVPAGYFATEGITVVAGNGHSVSFAYVTNRVTEVREANGLLVPALGYPSAPLQRTIQTTSYDGYGNPTLTTDYGIDGGNYDDERVTRMTYAHGGNALSLWVLDKLDTIRLTDEKGAFVAKQVYYYDGEPFVGVQGQIQTRALLSRKVDYIDATRSIDASRAQFDAFGNVKETRDPLGNARRMTWDSAFQTYPVTEVMVVGGGSPDLTMSAAYDTGFGVVTNAIDFNGHSTAYVYDSFARLVKVVRPEDTLALPTTSYEYQPADPIRGRAFVYDAAGQLTLSSVQIGVVSRVTTRKREKSGQAGEYITASYSDGCGRVLAVIEEGETAGTWLVRQATSYNLRGKPQSQWLPYQVSSVPVPQFPAIWPGGRPPVNDSINPSVLSTDFYYDPQGREIRAVNPPETWGGARRERVTQYLPFQKRLFDEEDLRAGSPHNNTPHVQYLDGLNRLIAVDEIVNLTDAGLPGPAAAWRTEYTYDLNDQLVRVKDSQGNIKIMAYDGLKRMTNMFDPDRGRMSFVYDDAGNLRQTVDAKGQKITYTYDGLNRIKTEDYEDGRPRVPDVEYFYDTAKAGLDLGDGTTGVASNTKGQIAWVLDESGEMHFSYDDRARIQWEVKRIPDRATAQLVSFRTRFNYDSADRLTHLTYPDGDAVDHDYNTRSLLANVKGSSLGDVIRSIQYRPSGQMQSISYGNRVGTAYVYDPRLRLTDLETTNSAQVRLMDLSYTFDALSNLERIEDQRSLNAQPDAAKRFSSQRFAYDDLYRLTRVDYGILGSSATNHVSYRYDRIGNMLEQSSDLAQVENGMPVANLGVMEAGGEAGRFNRNGRASNDPPGPHALTQIKGAQGATRDYQYDANGNLTVVDGMICEWDFKDRLAAAENASMRAVYTYDHRDRRVTKTVHWKQPGVDKGEEISTLNPAWRMTTTHYVNRYYEVREFDSPVKYVWNGQTRVARITAQLGGSTRIQPLRLQEGWNQVALRVGGQFPVLDPAQNADIASCNLFSSQAAGSGLAPVTATTTVPPGATLWIYARRAVTVMLAGTPATYSLAPLTGTSQFIGNVLPESIEVGGVFPSSALLSRYSTISGRWQWRYPAAHPLSGLNASNVWIRPGESVWTTGGTAGPLGAQLAALQVRYYHQDHLGSTAVVTDQNGELVEETSNYAFGQTRNAFRPRPVRAEAYGFTQKEKDEESGLHYFEARYLASTSGRFASVDRLITIDMKGLGQNPQSLNLYAYAQNNPLKYVDPMGLEVKATTTKDAKSGEESTKIEFSGVLMNESSTKMTDKELEAVKTRIVDQLKDSFTGKDGKNSWSISVNIRIESDKSKVKTADHVIRIVDSLPDYGDLDPLGAVNKIGGKDLRFKADLIPLKPSDPGNASLERTSAHEIGHSLGLRHDTDNTNPIRDKMQNNNLMRQTVDTDGTKVNLHEIRRIQKLYDDGKLNQ